MARAKKIFPKGEVLRDGAMSTFITVGNAKQEFERIFEICFSCNEQLSKPVVVQHGFTKLNHTFDISCQFMEQPEFVEQIKNAEIVVGHAGAGTIMTALQYGIKPIVIPRLSKYKEHIDDHQYELARALNNDGKVYMINNEAEMRELLSENESFGYQKTLTGNELVNEIANDISMLGKL